MTLHMDSRARIIVGLAVPYGDSARLRGRRRRFAPGWWVTDGQVPLCEEHVRSAERGLAVSLRDTPGGLLAALRVRRGAAGDRILTRAGQGRYGLSVGFDLLEESPDPEDAMVRVVTSAVLREISVTPNPAFGGAQ